VIERTSLAGSTIAMTRIGFGCARIYGGSELRGSARLIEAALSAGIRHFDTAPSYGNGQSEEVLGQVLGGAADVTIATKVGIERPDAESTRSAARLAYRQFVKPLLTHMPGVKSKLLQFLASRRDGSPAPPPQRRKLEAAHIRRELKGSLKRLKRNRVDLYLVHEPDQFELDDEALETFLALVREGAIGAFGLAFGRTVDATPDFGTVIQSQYRQDRPTPADDRTRIFHGVLRHGWRDSGSTSNDFGDVGGYFRGILDTNPKAAIIFSATTAHQILQVTTAF
jgi:aryl-alcohol dehydrogenase-like predicted oxidoreductase